MKEMQYFSYLTEFLFEDWKFSYVTSQQQHVRAIVSRISKICLLNILCVFFILTLEKERAGWLKTHNLFWKA